jgi:hypothetical protein
MGKRHDAIGIKQAIRFEWMQRAANLLLAGLDAKSIRRELHEFLVDKQGSGSLGERSDKTRSFAVNNLMRSWVLPDSELLPFRDASLACLQDNPSLALSLHWGMISAAYPFWFNVARQTGRLLALQNRVTQAQIVQRLKEQYGDRETVSRYGRYVLRSFVAWGVLRDDRAKGCYAQGKLLVISDHSQAALLYEAALLSVPDASSSLRHLQNNPGFFPFQVTALPHKLFFQHDQRLQLVHCGFDDALLQLKNQ